MIIKDGVFTSGVRTQNIISKYGTITNFNSTNSQIATLNVSNITVSGNIDISGNLTVYGDTKLNNLDISGNLTVYGDTKLNNLDVSGTFYLDAFWKDINNTNCAVGKNSLIYTTGTYNTAIGTSSLGNNTTGSSNSAVGHASLAENSSGTQNCAMGVSSLRYNSTGSNNSALGVSSLGRNTTGNNNTAMGVSSLRNNETGINNTAFGTNALSNNIGTNGSTAIGNNALRQNITANNTAVGSSALENNTDGGNSCAVGHASLFTNTTGDNNTAMGVSSLRSNTTGNNNIAVGRSALVNNTIESYNTALGSNAGSDVSGNGFSYTTSIGYNAKPTQSNQVVLGTSAEQVYVPGSLNVDGRSTFNDVTEIISSELNLRSTPLFLDGASPLTSFSGASFGTNVSTTGGFISNGNCTFGNEFGDSHTINGSLSIGDSFNPTTTNINSTTVNIGPSGLTNSVNIDGNLNVSRSFNKLKIYYSHITGNSNTIFGTIDITGSGNGTTNYAVFSSIYYGFSGSAGTYNASGTSGAVNPIIITDITPTTFSYVATKATGDNVNIYIQFMVYFDDSADFPKSY